MFPWNSNPRGINYIPGSEALRRKPRIIFQKSAEILTHTDCPLPEPGGRGGEGGGMVAVVSHSLGQGCPNAREEEFSASELYPPSKRSTVEEGPSSRTPAWAEAMEPLPNTSGL